jgi:hypothetical protein
LIFVLYNFGPRHRWEDNIKMDLKEVGCEDIDLIDVAWDGACGGLCEHGNEPSNSLKCWEFLDLLRKY